MSALTLGAEAQEVVRGEAMAVRAMARDEDYRNRLAAVAAAAGEGTVDEDDLPELSRLLQLGLQSGRLRSIYGPAGERAALALYRRLPEGAALRESASEVSAALGALQGRELEAVGLEAVGPGSFRLSLAAGGLEISVLLDRQGARVASVGA